MEGQRRARGGGLGTFNAEAYLAVDENRRRLEWGAEVERDYSGWLEVAEGADGESQVTVHLSFGERSVEPMPPPPCAEPATGENPAVVDVDPPDAPNGKRR